MLDHGCYLRFTIISLGSLLRCYRDMSPPPGARERGAAAGQWCLVHGLFENVGPKKYPGPYDHSPESVLRLGQRRSF
jgi:hypothetical protein